MSIIRKTKTVKLVLDEFNKNKDAIPVVDLIDKFKNKMDKTTVYRIIERLEESNIVHSFIDSEGIKRYVKSNSDNHYHNESKIHPHFLCEDCGISSCIPIEIKIPSIPNYNIKSSEHLLIGQCKDCLN